MNFTPALFIYFIFRICAFTPCMYVHQSALAVRHHILTFLSYLVVISSVSVRKCGSTFVWKTRWFVVCKDIYPPQIKFHSVYLLQNVAE